MKKRTAWLMVLALLLTIALPLIGGAEEEKPLVVGSLTKMSGHFFSEMWGNNTADNDVRGMLHSYPTIVWTIEGQFFHNPTVVRSIDRTTAPNGDATFTLELQRDLTYNDGTPITAKDYVFNLLLESSPLIPQLGGQSALKDHIVGAVAYSKGEADALAGLHLLDEYRYAITVSADALPYYYELAFVHTMPAPVHVIAPGCEVRDDGDGAYMEGPFTAELLRQTILDPQTGYVTHPKVTSGPYNLTSYDGEAGVATFELNPLFKGNHQGKKPTVAKVEFREVNNQELVGLLRTGEVDWVNKITSGDVINQLPSLLATRTANFLPYPRSGFAYLAFAAERPLTSSLSLRQAVAHMIDSSLLITDFLKGRGQRALGYYGLGQWMPQAAGEQLSELDIYPLDLEMAQALLMEDGWTLNQDGEAYDGEGLRYRQQGETLEPLTLSLAVTPGNVAAQMVAEQLEAGLAAVGGQLEVATIQMPELLQRYYRQIERKYDLFFLASNFAYVFDPYYTYHTGDAYQGALNTSGLKDETLMQAAVDLRRTPPGDQDGYLNNWITFQREWVRAMPMVPLYTNTYFDAFSLRLGDYDPADYSSWADAMVYISLNEDIPLQKGPLGSE